MFQKYVIPQHSVQLNQSNIVSLSFTELSTEPSTLHSHPHFEVLVPQNNFGLLLCNNEQTVMQKNMLYIIPANITHAEINEHKVNKAKYFAIKFSTFLSTDSKYFFSLDVSEESGKINSYLSNAYSSFATDDNTFALLNLACFSHLLNKILKQRNSSSAASVAPELVYASFTKEIKHYLTNNYDKDIKIEEIAQKYNISHSTLIKNFKTSFGLTPKDYLIQVRLDKAKELLKSSNFTISFIATACGFWSAAYFTKIFREKFNVPPKKYRQGNTPDNEA